MAVVVAAAEAGSRRQGEGARTRAAGLTARFSLLPFDPLKEEGKPPFRHEPLPAKLQARQAALLQVLVDGVLVDAQLFSDPLRIPVVQPGLIFTHLSLVERR